MGVRKTSTESNQSPKAAQPSCLRGAFSRIFLKRTESNNRTEEDLSSNQNAEDQEGVRGKKRRVTGSIFRLPCLRPADTTGNDMQEKTDEQSHDVVQEEELKPYSKASFLRKIRCYRLMREKDATEKEKVIEMGQHKQNRDNTEVKQYKERVLEQSTEGLQSFSQDEVVGGKDTKEQQCHAKSLGEAGNDFQEQDFIVEHVRDQESSLRKQECYTEKLSGPGEGSMRTENLAQDLADMGKDLAEQESCVETLKEKNVLLEGEVSLLDDKNLAEQESQIRKAEKKEHGLAGVSDQEEDMLEQNKYAAKVEDLGNVVLDNVREPEQMGKQEKCMSNQEEGTTEKDVPNQQSHGIMITNTEESVGSLQKYFLENKCHTNKLEDAGTYLSEQDGLTEKAGNTENNLSGQQCLEGDTEDTRNCLQDGGEEMKRIKEKDVTEQDSQRDSTDKMENNESYGEKEGHVETSGDQENNLIDQDSQVEKIRKDISQQGSQYIVKDSQAEKLAKLGDNAVEVSGGFLGVQDDQNFTNSVSNQGLTMTILNQESVTSETCHLQDSSATRTMGSEDNEELMVTTANNISCTSSEEAHTQVLQLQKEVLTSANAMDLTYQESHILHGGVNNEDDLGSLRVEVKDMVEWIVQEASDRLSHYTHESEGTG